ncbi:MAG: DnaB-like helicase C-terminal domain-containing protein [Thermoplasmata archaeon]
MDNITKYVELKGWEYKLSGLDQLNIKTCPFCGDQKWHFYINRLTGLYCCFKSECQASGNFAQLRKHVDSELLTLESKPIAIDKISIASMHEALMNDREGRRWLLARKISTDAMEHFKLGIKYRNNDKQLVIPYIYKSEIRNVKFRHLNEKKFYQTTGGERLLYNADALEIEPCDSIIVVEGELDCIAGWSQGIKNIVSVPDGADSPKSLTGYWIDLLATKKVYICFDNDISGERGTYHLAKRLQYKNCFYVKLPDGIKDLNEFFIAGNTIEDFYRLIDKAEEIHIRNVIPFASAVNNYKKYILTTGEILSGYDSPWNSLNRKLLLREGELVILSGPSGVGKTTLCLNWAWHIAQMQVPIGFVCLEMTEHRIIQKLTKSVMETENVTVDVIDDMLSKYAGIPLYLIVQHDNELTSRKVAETISDIVLRYNIKVLFFDNLQFLLNDIHNTTTEESLVSKQFKLLTTNLNVCIVLISHMRKVYDVNAIPKRTDLRGSSMIYNNADSVLFLFRRMKNIDDVEDGDLYENDALLLIDKGRYSETGKIRLFFQAPISKFISVENHAFDQMREDF